MAIAPTKSLDRLEALLGAILEGSVPVDGTTFRDLSEVRALAGELHTVRDLRELSEAIVRCSQEAISISDAAGRTVLVNPAYTKLMGLTEAEVLGRPVTADIAEGESVHLRVLRTREAIRGARLRVGPHGREVIVNAAPLIVGGELRGSVGVIRDVSEIQRLSAELASARRLLRKLEPRRSFDDILGDGPAITRAKELARRAARTPATVLLLGESGTGKELFAHAIHDASDRREGPLIRVNCAAIPEGLLESALFGYEGGAFTGARARGQKGHFEEAEGGTLFLDEVAEAPLALQVKLLRALQEREIVRVGSSRPVPVDVRLVAATNADLAARLARGAFRRDLFYRLSVMPIRLPSLRERREDVPLLARELLARICEEYRVAPVDLTPDALALLQASDWKGNVRELENVLRRGVIDRPPDASVLRASDLVLEDAAPGVEAGAPAAGGPRPLAALRADWERQLLRAQLARNGGNREATARALGITARNLYYKLRRYRLG
ncbi:sigma-54 interaction domain-containing protein [Anaeromyxobacter oryzisoli]|uniref:sigma-54 interaction domain-containing protein n=1 Tax=Anaeromyxobacter oryzisoli TaxID=2925408 RepID=UPI001F57C0B3|nr:sigma 54-interacting transcriptional regulator [Anaeromyxobacter sp. SG63]